MLKRMVSLCLALLCVMGPELKANEAAKEEGNKVSVKNDTEHKLQVGFALVSIPLFGSPKVSLQGETFDVAPGAAIKKSMPSLTLGSKRQLFVTYAEDAIKNGALSYKTQGDVSKDAKSLLIPIGTTSGTGFTKTGITVKTNNLGGLIFQEGPFVKDAYEGIKGLVQQAAAK